MNYPPLNATECIQAVPAKLTSVKRSRTAPIYDFVEFATREGSCFTLPRDGYFVVAPETSLLPRFVVELKLPTKATIGELIQLSYTLVGHSSGMLWFDSDDDDAHQFCWYLQLPVSVKAPLFVWPETDQNSVLKDSRESSIIIADPNNDLERGWAVSFLTSFPVYRGGQAKEYAEKHVDDGRVRLLKVDDRFIGAAIVNDQRSVYSTVTIVIDNNHQSKGFGVKFMNAIGLELSRKGRKAIVSMSDDLPASFRGAKALGMQIVKHSYIAQIGTLM